MIGISLLTLVPGLVGGAETYARELCRALARVGELEYRAYVPTIAEDAADGLPSRAVAEYRASRTTPGRIAAMASAALAPGRIRRALGLAELDAIHFPLSVMLPPVDAPPAATTVLDVQHEVFPQFFSRAERLYRRRVYRVAVERARLVVAVSEHVRTEVLDLYRLDPSRVRAVHHGVDHERFRPDGRAREPFLLYPANAWPHKNHPRLFEAFTRVRRRRRELRLLLTGAGHQRLRLPAGARSLGHLPRERLADLYRSASALVYPSLYEGFGLPCLEAMACGCPVACANAASLPEVCGDAAVYFDPTSAEDIARAIDHVLDHPPPGGPEHAAQFTWERCAREHDAVYRELACES